VVPCAAGFFVVKVDIETEYSADENYQNVDTGVHIAATKSVFTTSAHFYIVFRKTVPVLFE